MAKFNKNSKSELSALTSDSVIITTWHGRTVVSKKPPPKKRKGNSPKQQQNIDRLRAAHRYAKRISREKQALYEMYEKGINPKRTSAHTVALQDYLRPPVIHYIKVYDFTGKAGDVITVKATDDFRVEAVAVEVFDRNGMLLEKGNAEHYQRKPFIWKFKTTVANKNFDGSTIVVTAMDMAGNKTEMTGRLHVKPRDGGENPKTEVLRGLSE